MCCAKKINVWDCMLPGEVRYYSSVRLSVCAAFILPVHTHTHTHTHRSKAQEYYGFEPGLLVNFIVLKIAPIKKII